MDLKIFSFLPYGNGQSSIYIVDTSKENAMERITQYIRNNKLENNHKFLGWGPDFYDCIENEITDIILNDNC